MSPRAATPSVIDVASPASPPVSLRSALQTAGMLSPYSFPSSRSSTPDSMDARIPPSLYSTALMGPAAAAASAESVENPFSNIHALNSIGNYPHGDADIQSSHMTLVAPELYFDDAFHDSDDIISVASDDTISSGSGSALDDDLLDVLSQQGSDHSSWASVGRRTPDV